MTIIFKHAALTTGIILFCIILINTLFPNLADNIIQMKNVILSKTGIISLICIYGSTVGAVYLATLISRSITKMPNFGLISFVVLVYATLKSVTLNLIIEDGTNLKDKKSWTTYIFKLIETWGYSIGVWGMSVQYFAPILFGKTTPEFSISAYFLVGTIYLVFIFILISLCGTCVWFINKKFGK